MQPGYRRVSKKADARPDGLLRLAPLLWLCSSLPARTAVVSSSSRWSCKPTPSRSASAPSSCARCWERAVWAAPISHCSRAAPREDALQALRARGQGRDAREAFQRRRAGGDGHDRRCVRRRLLRLSHDLGAQPSKIARPETFHHRAPPEDLSFPILLCLSRLPLRR
jgi:hypothetical protein